MKVLIMAGGRGVRFWPLSQPDFPKQCIQWAGKDSLLTQSILRALKLTSPDNVFVITGPKMLDAVLADAGNTPLPKSNIITEPSPRNTAPCIALALGQIFKVPSKESILIMPADHLIQKEEDWLLTILSGLSSLSSSAGVILFGLVPDRPHTGYGYIEAVEKIRPKQMATVEQFIEKPDLKTANLMFGQSQYLWNAGMILCGANQLEEAYSLHLPHSYHLINRLRSNEPITEHWHSTETISLDYGILERMESLSVIAMEVGWSDVGSWDSAQLVLPKTEYGHGTSKKTVSINSNNCIVYAPEMSIALIGVQDIAVVKHHDQILVLNLSDAQAVRRAVDELEKTQSI
jgi:mannose-1-phosphate guanylyltransferase/mannose-6-phosphate isomerase